MVERRLAGAEVRLTLVRFRLVAEVVRRIDLTREGGLCEIVQTCRGRRRRREEECSTTRSAQPTVYCS